MIHLHLGLWRHRVKDESILQYFFKNVRPIPAVMPSSVTDNLRGRPTRSVTENCLTAETSLRIRTKHFTVELAHLSPYISSTSIASKKRK